MTLGQEKLDVYRLSIGYVVWVYEKAEGLTGVHRSARDQWLRASQSIPLNIAEGNGKTADADRRRYFEIALSSACDCAAIQLSWLSAKRWNARRAVIASWNSPASRQCSDARAEEDTTGEKNKRTTGSISIPRTISNWITKTGSPYQAFQATLDSAPERTRS